MPNLKQQLLDVGLPCSMTLRETGQQLTLNFARGESSKLVHLVMGNFSVEGKLALVPDGTAEDRPNLRLEIQLEGAPSTAPAKPAPVEALAPKAEASPPKPPETPVTEAPQAKAVPELPVEEPISETLPLRPEGKRFRK